MNLLCPFCAFQNSPGAAFCVNCGTSLPRPAASTAGASEAERRFVTMLFADISGFTPLSESRDPEMVREVINTCFDLLVPIVERYSGVVDQFVGDAIVALFGAPVARENDPAQACRAALDMLQAIDTVNRRYTLELGLHIGINSGTVIAGDIGSRGRKQYSVLGDAVNLASRLQDAAKSGEIFVGEQTYKLTREQFEYVSLGTMPFKGKSAPQAVWQLLGVRDYAHTRRRILTDTPLLGRERELGLLQSVTRHLEPDELRVVSILGDAGLGKSRLVLEWQQAVRASSESTQTQFVTAACAPDGLGRDYALLTELVRVLGEPFGQEKGILPLDSLLSENSIADLAAPDAVALQARYTSALRELISRRAAVAPLVLVCEDLHWADAPSTRVLGRALAQLEKTQLVVAFTSRIDLDTPGWQLIISTEELAGSAAVRLNLAALSDTDANSLVDSLLPGTWPPEIRERILAQAEGNPLFVEELAHMFLDHGDMQRANGEWELNPGGIPLAVPNTLQGVLMARVNQLPPEARRVLQVASVLGREFSLETLRGMMARLEQTPQAFDG